MNFEQEEAPCIVLNLFQPHLLHFHIQTGVMLLIGTTELRLHHLHQEVPLVVNDAKRWDRRH
jgi:hypothetical protein